MRNGLQLERGGREQFGSQAFSRHREKHCSSNPHAEDWGTVTTAKERASRIREKARSEKKIVG